MVLQKANYNLLMYVMAKLRSAARPKFSRSDLGLACLNWLCLIATIARWNQLRLAVLSRLPVTCTLVFHLITLVTRTQHNVCGALHCIIARLPQSRNHE